MIQGDISTAAVKLHEMLRCQHLIMSQTKDKHFHLILQVKIFDKDLSKWQSDCQWQEQ